MEKIFSQLNEIKRCLEIAEHELRCGVEPRWIGVARNLHDAELRLSALVGTADACATEQIREGLKEEPSCATKPGDEAAAERRQSLTRREREELGELAELAERRD